MLDWEDYMKIGENTRTAMEEWHNVGKTEEQIEREKNAKEQSNQPPQTYESSLSLMLYIIVMIVGSIFYDRVLIWIAATIIFFGHKRKHCNKK